MYNINGVGHWAKSIIAEIIDYAEEIDDFISDNDLGLVLNFEYESAKISNINLHTIIKLHVLTPAM